MATRLVHVVFEALDVRILARFWSKALGWRLVEEFFQYDEGSFKLPTARDWK